MRAPGDGSGRLRAQEPAESPALDLSVEVPVWTDQLDADDVRSRREAERKLIDAGPAAAEFIPAITDHLSMEAKQRLKRVQNAWKSAKAKKESAEVVVRWNNATTLDGALEAISAASGVEFEHEVDGTMSFIAPATPLGFWHSLDLVLDQAELDINFYAGDRNTLRLDPRREERTSRVDSAAYSGIYRLEPTIVTARRVLGSPQLSGLNITMTISWQPNRNPIGLTIPVREVTGQLANGETLKPQDSGETIDIATSPELAQSEFYLPMQLPEGSPDRIDQVSGMIEALLPGNAAKFELALGDPAPSVTRDAMTVTLEEIRANGQLHELRVGIDLDAADRSLESHRQWIYENEAYVVLADGTRLDHLGYETYRQTPEGIALGYLFDLGGADVPATAKLVYESPTSVIPQQVSFVLRSIQLP